MLPTLLQLHSGCPGFFFFFFNDTATTEIYTLSLHDALPIYPRIVDGQIHGGLAQGFGEALLEQVVYDAEGQPLTTTFMDYLLPTAKEMPPVTIVHLETPSPLTTGGFKGMGESATIGSPACLANAVSDALGDAIDELPITPERVLVCLGSMRAVSERP